MSDNRATNVPEFLSELDAGIFENKISAVLNEVALGVLNNRQKGEVKITLSLEPMSTSAEEKRVKIKHKLSFTKPTPRGKSSEDDTTETPMFVNRGGKLTILQEDQGQLFGLNGSPDGKLRQQS